MNTYDLLNNKRKLYQCYKRNSYIPDSHVKQALKYFKDKDYNRYLSLNRTIYFIHLPNNLPYILNPVQYVIINYLI